MKIWNLEVIVARPRITKHFYVESNDIDILSYFHNNWVYPQQVHAGDALTYAVLYHFLAIGVAVSLGLIFLPFNTFVLSELKRDGNGATDYPSKGEK